MSEPTLAASRQQLTDATNVLGRRVGAFIIDFAIMVMLVLPIVLSSSTVHENAQSGYCSDAGLSSDRCVQSGNVAIDLGASGVLRISGSMAVFWMALGAIEGRRGAFLGKRVTRLQVIGIDGQRAGVARGALRGLLMFADSLFGFMVGLVLVGITRPRRRLGDFAARTLVVSSDAIQQLQHDPITWDDSRGAYVYRDPVLGQQMVWNDGANEWMPLTDE